MSKQQLTFPLDQASKDILAKEFASIIGGVDFLQAIWKSHFYFMTVFEGTDRLYTPATGTIQSVDDEGLVLEVQNGSGSDTNMTLFVAGGSSLVRHDKLTRARAAMKTLNNSNVDFYVTTLGGDGNLGFGFEDGKIVGFSYDGTTETTITLRTSYTADTFYELEYRYFPKDKIVFLVDGVERGTIRVNLPKGTPTTIYDVSIHRDTTATQDGHVSFFELMQRK